MQGIMQGHAFVIAGGYVHQCGLRHRSGLAGAKRALP